MNDVSLTAKEQKMKRRYELLKKQNDELEMLIRKAHQIALRIKEESDE